MIVGILFLPCLSVVDFNFWTIRDRDLFGMCTQLMVPFKMTLRSVTLTLTFMLKIAFSYFIMFIADGGMVCHKHILFMKWEKNL